MRSQLKDVLERLSLHSVESVQDGNSLSAFDEYMHVERPIEGELRSRMRAIERSGGGIVLLVGSAGDGKSHLISRMRKEFSWGDECFYNDATASSSPRKDAIATLKEALVEYKDINLGSTCRKLVLAINLGKLNAFIDDEEVKKDYSCIVKASVPIFDEDDTTPPEESDRIKVVLFTDEQIFEFHPDNESEYPVSSSFISLILEKIASRDEDNPFYRAYKMDIQNEMRMQEPCIINYELLQIAAVRKTIEMSLIEAIVRYKLLITPREFLDFIYSIIVHPQIDRHNFTKNNYLEALLPTLLYEGTRNLINNAVSKLDPFKYSNLQHDEILSCLFTSLSIPEDYLPECGCELPRDMVDMINKLYDNNGRDITRVVKFVYRLGHVLNYHSECKDYISYLNLLRNLFRGEINEVMQEMDELVNGTIPRHSASYYDKQNMIPLNTQGSMYRLFTNLQIELNEIPDNLFNPNSKTRFFIRFMLAWSVKGETVKLQMDYQLYTYLQDLKRGKLAVSYENDKHIGFSSFLRDLTALCESSSPITIVRVDNKELTLMEKYKSIFLQ